ILKWAQKKRKDPRTLILDQTYHHSAILRLGPRETARGRPDIPHLSLLLALGSPLNLTGGLKCYVHTRDNNIIRVDSRARLPRNTTEFTISTWTLGQLSRELSTTTRERLRRRTSFQKLALCRPGRNFFLE